ncbi:JID1 [Candida oxycetoniae]|uniref:JID1 n=1 Tax=Candida oxycetoniae TaxID=497107 RepID=A0AAI9WYY7_9ASCO|nr:JID1 [Candida oxycetoniae]KAI3405812.2 JID1 [Candida oxycetoniae]
MLRLFESSLSRAPLVRICRCGYATSGDYPIDHHQRLDLHEWPTSANPTPYEVFGLSSKDMGMSTLELNKILKDKYVKFVKIYHPDTCLEITDANGKVFSKEMKRRRFDIIQESYDILKNPRRRGAYNRYQTTSWEQQGPYKGPYGQPYTKESFEAYRRANAHRTRYNFSNDEAFWSAGTWNDYYQMKYKRPPPTREDFEKNKYKILWGVLAVGALSFGLQVMNAIDQTNQYLLKTHQMNLRSLKDMNESYESNGEGFSEVGNLKRFLISRRSTIKSKRDKSNEDNEENIEPSDNDLLIKYAQGRVDKWDRRENELSARIRDD